MGQTRAEKYHLRVVHLSSLQLNLADVDSSCQDQVVQRPKTLYFVALQNFLRTVGLLWQKVSECTANNACETLLEIEYSSKQLPSGECGEPLEHWCIRKGTMRHFPVFDGFCKVSKQLLGRGAF